jgi:hypothetical protein
MYKCTICNTAFKQEKQLQLHTEQHSHPEQAKIFRENQDNLLITSPYRCNACCDEPFIDLLSLQQHNRKEEITPGKHVQYYIPQTHIPYCYYLLTEAFFSISSAVRAVPKP